jgi:hypothetical protein
LRSAQRKTDSAGRPWSSLLNAAPAQILPHPCEELAMLVQPSRHRLQLAADLVFGEEIE